MRTYQQDHNRAMYSQALTRAREAFAAGLMTSPAWLAHNIATLGPGISDGMGKAIAHNSGNIGSDARDILRLGLEARAMSEAIDMLDLTELLGE